MGRFGNASGEIDCLVLGCTHYAFVATELATLVGNHIRLLEGGVPVARQTRRLLEQSHPGMLNQDPLAMGQHAPIFYSTGNLNLLESAVQRWLQLQGKTVFQKLE
jgi:glutamate racemase